MEFINETRRFCPSFEKELEEEKRIVESNNLKPLGNVNAAEVIFELTPYINVTKTRDEKTVLVCSECGYAYCEANENYKHYSIVNEREPEDIYPGRLAFHKDWCIFREFYCPGCGTQIEVEATPPGTPILRNYELEYL